MFSPGLIAFFSGLAVFFITMGIVRPQNSVWAATSTDSLLRIIDEKLKRANIVTVSAPVLLVGGLIAMGLVAAVVFFATGSIVLGVIASAITPFGIYFEIDRRSRQFQEKLNARLVPFLQKIISQLNASEPIAKSFVTAAREDNLISWVLRQQLKDLELQRPLNEILEDSISKIPTRPWIQFVRSLQAGSGSGGDLKETLAANVERINSQILLRARLMGDLAQYRSQQVIILGFAVVIPILLFFTGSGTFGSIFSSLGGIVMFCVAVALDAFALWMTNRAVRDVERRLDA